MAARQTCHPYGGEEANALPPLPPTSTLPLSRGGVLHQFNGVHYGFDGLPIVGNATISESLLQVQPRHIEASRRFWAKKAANLKRLVCFWVEKKASTAKVDANVGPQNASTSNVDAFFGPTQASTFAVDALFSIKKRINVGR